MNNKNRSFIECQRQENIGVLTTKLVKNYEMRMNLRDLANRYDAQESTSYTNVMAMIMNEIEEQEQERDELINQQ